MAKGSWQRHRSFCATCATQKKTLQEKTLRYCWSAREPQIVQITERRPERRAKTTSAPRNTNIAYSYLGRGVEWQPPSTDALVTGGMPLRIADRYFALLTFLAGGSVHNDIFERKQRAKNRQQLNEDDKHRSIRNRVYECTYHIKQLHRWFASPKHLLQWSGIFSFDDEAYIGDARKKKARR